MKQGIIFILLLGLGFSQTELTTRLYEVQMTHYSHMYGVYAGLNIAALNIPSYIFCRHL